MLTLLLSLFFASDVQDLGSDSFAAREGAEARLRAHSWLAWRACDRPFADPEQRRRAARVVEHGLGAGPWAPLSLALTPQEAVREYWSHLERDGYLETRFCRCQDQEPGPDYSLAWILASQRGGPRAWIARHYLERARTQHVWKDWYTIPEQRTASRLLARDLEILGAPRELTRWLLAER